MYVLGCGCNVQPATKAPSARPFSQRTTQRYVLSLIPAFPRPLSLPTLVTRLHLRIPLRLLCTSLTRPLHRSSPRNHNRTSFSVDAYDRQCQRAERCSETKTKQRTYLLFLFFRLSCSCPSPSSLHLISSSSLSLSFTFSRFRSRF